MLRKKMGRILLVTMLVMVCWVPMIANGQSEKITLDFPSWQATEPGFSTWWKEVVADFEKTHPNVNINFYQVPFKGYIDTLITRCASKSPPDILHLPSRNFPQFADSGWLEPLDPMLKKTDILSKWIPLQKGMIRNKKTYGIVLLGYGYILFYNEKMFKDAGVPVPQNPQQFIKAAQALTVDRDKNGQIDQYGYGMPTATHPNIYMEASKFVIGQGGHWSKAGKLTVKSAKVIKGLKFYQSLYRDKVVPMGITDEQKRQYFFDGKIAMMTDGPWTLALRNKAPADVAPYIKVAPMPFGKTCGGLSNGIHIPAGLSAAKKKLVWEFIYGLTRPQFQRRYSELTMSPPAREGVVDSALLQKYPEMKIFSQEAAKAIDFMPPGFEGQYVEFSTQIIDACMELSVPGTTVENVLSKLEKRLSSLED
jgi:multiple sugar transport system substrate-binding protein